ncbi:aldehyde dehydrogenase family protein, partial [Bacillus cereus group sp. Bce019]|uniref:aldehyde dehydrogenase family protein n=1 Tax=Bacillus cereus group sp. Bce019 TaxID=3445247 RepID=UPI003F282DDD
DNVREAIAAAATARAEWASWRWEDRAAVFLRAAELLTTTWRDTLLAATMLGQAKTVHQAEIDATCELIDFWRFNVQFAQELYAEQPLSDHSM